MRQVDTCFFCERTITRSAPVYRWESDGIPDCEFHPVAWDTKTNLSTGFSAPHMTELEIHDFIRFYSTKRPEMGAQRKVSDNVVSLSSRSSRTSRAAGKKVFPKTGTMRRDIYNRIKECGSDGMTDHELERYFDKKHQTISAARRSLVVDNYLVDSGRTRKNDTGNECTVWVIDATMQQYAQMVGRPWN